VHPAWSSCDKEKPAAQLEGLDAGPVTLPRLGADFQAVGAVVCATTTQSPPAGGEDLVAVEQRSEQVAALVAALRLPDEKPTNDFCTTQQISVPWFVLIDAQGRWVRPGVPVDGCGRPRKELRDALAALPLVPVSSHPIGVITSAAAARAGCSQSWSDMVAVVAQRQAEQRETPKAAPASDVPMRLCVYEVAPGEQGSGKPAGQFTEGGPLTAAEWASIVNVMPGAGPPAACREHAGRFAVLMPAAGTATPEPIYVELDGCHRLLTGTSLAQSGPELITALEQAAT
jgi:hypothetical protein